MSHLIDAIKLRSLINEANAPIVIDCRFDLIEPNLGRQQYQAGHIPGAHYIDLAIDLSGPVEPLRTGRHPLPKPLDLCHKLGALGVSNTRSVVAYDAGNGTFAARLWWLLRWLGHEQVQVLDGGLAQWLSAGGALSQFPPQPTATRFTQRSALTQFCTMQDIKNRQSHLIDVRDEPRFQGLVEPIDAVPGHIPGAINIPFAANLEHGRFKTPEALRKQFSSQSIAPSDPVICYCGSGVTATHTILALLEAGHAEPTLYPGSWSEWITDSSNPVARDDHDPS